MAHNVAGLVFHRDNVARRECRPSLQVGDAWPPTGQLGFGAVQNKRDVRIAFAEKAKPGNNCCRSFVTAHGINRDDGVARWSV